MRNEQGVVEVGVGNQKFSRPYTKIIYETTDDVLGSLQEPKKAREVIDFINSALDLSLRAPVRAAILANEASQANTEEKQVKDIMKSRAMAGKPVTEDQARKLVALFATMEIPS